MHPALSWGGGGGCQRHLINMYLLELSVVSFLSFEGLEGQPLVGFGILSGNRQFLKDIQLRFNLQPKSE